MTEQHPLAASIDRALSEYIWEDAVAREELLRDILAEIGDEYGPITVERVGHYDMPPAGRTRIVSEWRAE